MNNYDIKNPNIHLQANPMPMTQRKSQKREWKDFKSQRVQCGHLQLHNIQ